MRRIIRTLAASSLFHLILGTLVAVVLLVLGAYSAHAADAEQKCQKGRYDAAAKYVSCHQKVLPRRIAIYGGTSTAINRIRIDPSAGAVR